MNANMKKLSNQKKLSDPPTHTASDDNAIKYIAYKIQEWYPILKPKLVYALVIGLIVGVTLGVYTSICLKNQYKASYRIFLQEESNGLSNAMRLASTIGIPVNGDSHSLGRTVQSYLISRVNVSNTLLDSNKHGRLIDRFYTDVQRIDDFQFKNNSNKKSELDKRFTDSLLIKTYENLIKNNVFVLLDEKSNLIDFEVISSNESFSFDLANSMVENTKKYFANLKRAKAQNAIRSFEIKVDSLELEIDKTLNKMAANTDRNKALISSLDRVADRKLLIEIEALKTGYTEYIKGRELSRIEMTNITNPIQYFDSPIYPLEVIRTSPVRYSIVGGCMSFLFMLGAVLIKHEIAKIFS